MKFTLPPIEWSIRQIQVDELDEYRKLGYEEAGKLRHEVHETIDDDGIRGTYEDSTIGMLKDLA